MRNYFITLFALFEEIIYKIHFTTLSTIPSARVVVMMSPGVSWVMEVTSLPLWVVKV